jgi:hypothetical protein
LANTGTAQDDARENRLVDLFNLTRPSNRVRHGTDAILLIDGHELEFELKSVTRARGGVSTVRDLGRDHIAKWANKHWLIAFFSGQDLRSCRYGSPAAMAPWIARTWDYIKLDFEMAELIPARVDLETMQRIIGAKDAYTLADARKLQKNQFTAAQYQEAMDLSNGYSAEQMLEVFRRRVNYVISRGSTLNNPHIPMRFIETLPKIESDHSAALRALVRSWLAAEPPQSLALNDKP